MVDENGFSMSPEGYPCDSYLMHRQNCANLQRIPYFRCPCLLCSDWIFIELCSVSSPALVKRVGSQCYAKEIP